MTDITQDSIRALIASNEAISESVKAHSETAKATNEIVRELTVSVQELVSTERERVVKDKFQQEVNVKQDIINIGNDAKWKEAHDTIVRAKRFHAVWDSVTAKIAVVIAIALLALLGFNFR
jgi:hypothetical protein